MKNKEFLDHPYTELETGTLRDLLKKYDKLYLNYVHSEEPSWRIAKTLAAQMMPVYDLVLERIKQEGLDRKTYLEDLKFWR